jgi:TRAP-type C4-dicarboxylate transport system permease small subunit
VTQTSEFQANTLRANTNAVRAALRVGNAIANFFAFIAAFAIIIIVIICAINVTRRYVFGMAWNWAEEAMVYLMIAAVFSGAITVTWRNTHMRIELIIDRLPRKIRDTAVFCVSLIAITVLATMSYFSTQVVITLYAFEQKTDALEMPMWIPQSIVAIGFGLFAIMTALRIYVHGTARGQSELDLVAKDKL